MHLNNSSLLPLAIALVLVPACGDDGGSSDGSNDSTGTATDNPGTTTDDPGTTTDNPGTTTDDPATSTGPDPDSSGDPPADMAMVRVMHLGVNAPGVDVFANGEGPVFENLEFRNSTQYAEVPAGDYTFDVSVTGMPADQAVLSPMLTLDADTSYTAVAIGDLNEAAPIDLQAIALVDDAEGLDPANVRITVIHAAPAVGEVDIWEITGEPILLLENVPFGGSATLDDLPAGPVEVGVDVDDDMVPDLTFSVNSTGLGGSQVNVYANNDAAGDVALIAQLPDGSVLPILPN
ncbi:MAG: DUF4397 domain-containing protein [Deltaproteobacteria bacterium]|nr:DUF4397 domain-containing protein [Deltaproteobacteria bacterium]